MPVGRPRADQQLAHCREVALTCQACISQSGRDLVQIAGSLDGSTIRQLFASMYPDAQCQSKAPAFVQLVMREQAARNQRIVPQPIRHAAVA